MTKEEKGKELLGGRDYVKFANSVFDGLPYAKALNGGVDALDTMNELLNDDLSETIPEDRFLAFALLAPEYWLRTLFATLCYLLQYTNIYRRLYEKSKEELTMAMIEHRVTMEENIKTLDERYE